MRVSLQQAANNAFATWLAGKLLDVPVDPYWPAPDRASPPRTITVVLAGERRDFPIEPRALKQTNVGSTQTTAVWQIAACEQPIQLDVWADTDAGRDDILARLDDFLHADQSPIDLLGVASPGFGCLIALADGWDDSQTIADFVFENPSLDNTSDSEGRAIYRATFQGTAYLKLTVTATTARQAAINFQLRLQNPDGSYSDP